MNFTKEYIKECDCKEIQGLREDGVYKGRPQKKFLIGDARYFVDADLILYQNIEDLYSYPMNIWLPTGDQLDDEIKQLCMKNPMLRYEASWIGTCWETYILENDFPKPKVKFFEGNPDRNLAKILLLKALLRDQHEPTK